MARGRELTLRIVEDTSAIRKATGQTATGIGRINSQIGRLSTGLAGVGIAFGTSQVVDFLMGAAEAAREDEKQTRLLTQTIRNAIPAWDGNTAAIENQIAAAEQWGIADDKVREGLIRAFQLTSDYNTALNLNATALDVAASLGVDQAEAIDIINKAVNGEEKALKRLGISKDADKDKTEKFIEISDKFAGTAAANSDALDVQRVKADEAAEALGRLVVNMQDFALITAGEIAKPIENWFDNLFNNRSPSQQFEQYLNEQITAGTKGADIAPPLDEYVNNVEGEMERKISEMNLADEWTRSLSRMDLPAMRKTISDSFAAAAPKTVEAAGINVVLKVNNTKIEGLNARAAALKSLREGLKDPTLRDEIAKNIKYVNSDAFKKGLKDSDPEVRLENRNLALNTAKEWAAAYPDAYKAGKSSGSAYINGILDEMRAREQLISNAAYRAWRRAKEIEKALKLVGTGTRPTNTGPIPQSLAPGSGVAAASVVVNIQTGVGDPVAIGREVSRTLDAYTSRGGAIG